MCSRLIVFMCVSFLCSFTLSFRVACANEPLVKLGCLKVLHCSV